jgi:hypothetical protein
MNKPQNSYGVAQTTTLRDGKPPMSILWPLGMLAGWVICFIAGAGLIAAYVGTASCVTNIVDGYAQRVCTGGNKGEYYAGLAFIVLAVILKLVFWVLLIMRCVQRRRGYVTVTTIVENNQSVHDQQIPLTRYEEQGQFGEYNKHSGPQYVPEQGPTGYPPQAYQDNAPLHQQRYS